MGGVPNVLFFNMWAVRDNGGFMADTTKDRFWGFLHQRLVLCKGVWGPYTVLAHVHNVLRAGGCNVQGLGTEFGHRPTCYSLLGRTISSALI